MGAQIEAVEVALRRVYGGRAWLVTSDVLQGAIVGAERLLELGATAGFAVGARLGTGDLPDPSERLSWRCLDLPPAGGMIEAIRDCEAALQDLPDDVLAAVDAFDPGREARVLGPIFAVGADVAGRRFYGARPPAWQALEDKVVIDALWDEVTVPRAPSRVVAPDAAALSHASEALDLGHGVVWAGDARDGFHGGAAYTWWVRDEPTAAEALAFLGPRCDTVRVMPFLEGIPCSIHGVVFPDHVVVLRPAEMVVLRRADGNGFRYARAATFWDPPGSDRRHLRAVARRVGQHLRQTLDYRGAFTIDGVLTTDGFRPTELNPRVGAALGLMVSGVSFDLLSYALIEGEVSGVDAVALEQELLQAADAQRSGALSLLDDTPGVEPGRWELVWTGEGWREAAGEEAPDARLRVGAGATGNFLSLVLDPERTPVGPSVAPRAVALARWADTTLGTSLGALEAASDVTLTAR
jgi:hypothetical protein